MKPKPAGTSALSINKRYALAHQKVLSTLEPWKLKAYNEDSAAKKYDSRILDEVSKATIELAESDQEIFLTT